MNVAMPAPPPSDQSIMAPDWPGGLTTVTVMPVDGAAAPTRQPHRLVGAMASRLAAIPAD
jgi:hypothetical protein